jgi:hypothetical protein
MSEPISITLKSGPFVTIERYAEISGLPVETIKKYVKTGRITVKKKAISEKSSRTRTLINMFDISATAASESKTKINLIFEG